VKNGLLHVMKKSRFIGVLIIVIGFVFNEWAFRFIFPLEPIDSFLRLMTLVLNAFLIIVAIALLATDQSIKERMRELMNRWPSWVAAFFGLFMCYCLMMVVEFSCRFYFKNIYEAPYSEKTTWIPRAYDNDDILGIKSPLDTTITHEYIVNDSLIYLRHYQIDEVGRRKNLAGHDTTNHDRFAMITGCSFAFGYGLNEKQTLAHFIDSLTHYRSYNYGTSGHGTQQTLSLLRSRNLHSEIDEQNGALIHLFIDDHIPRLIGSRRMIKLWARSFPYYYLDGDSLIQNGSFWTGRPMLSRFYKAISESAFIDLFDIDFPWYTSESHLKLFGAILQASKAEFLSQYPNGRFLVVIGPSSKLASRVTSVLAENGVDYLDCSDLLDKEMREYQIHWTEAHPNEKYYLELAKAIKDHL